MKPSDLVATILAAEAKRDADPLAFFTWPSDRHRDGYSHVSAGIEAHHRGANYSAKTRSMCAWITAFMQQRKELDGIPMPFLGRRIVGAMLIPTREQAKDSSQDAMRKCIGRYPHFEAMFDRGNDLVSTIWVKPQIRGVSDDHRTWSRITFLPQGDRTPDSIRGQRWDFVGGDDKVVEDFWREARKNAKYRIIAETPVKEPEWGWIQRDFDGPLGVPAHGRVEFVTTLYDNGHLTPDMVAAKEDEYRGDKYWRARRYGEYVNVDGDNPLPYETLEKLLRWADPGEPWEGDKRIEVWRKPSQHMPCFVIADPSSGIRPSATRPGGDACAFWVCGRRKVQGRYPLMARFFGHVPPHELARMCMKVGRWYTSDLGPAMLVPEINGVGEAMLPEIVDYPNVFREYALDREDKSLSGQIGWYETTQSKAASLGALITTLTDDTLDIPCASAIRSLMAIRTNQRDQLVRKDGQNHEDLSCAGKWAYLLGHPSYAAAMAPAPRQRTSEEHFRELVGLPAVAPQRVWEPPIEERWR